MNYVYLEAEAKALRVDFAEQGVFQSELSTKHQSKLKPYREKLDALRQKQDAHYGVEMLFSLETHQCPALDVTHKDIRTLHMLNIL